MKISQEELANKCNVTRQTINAIENNKYDHTLSLAFNLSKNFLVGAIIFWWSRSILYYQTETEDKKKSH